MNGSVPKTTSAALHYERAFKRSNAYAYCFVGLLQVQVLQLREKTHHVGENGEGFFWPGGGSLQLSVSAELAGPCRLGLLKSAVLQPQDSRFATIGALEIKTLKALVE